MAENLLKPLDVERQTEPGKYFDGGGLYFIVVNADARSWAYRYWFKGKERWYGLGSFNDVSLREARQRRNDARKLVHGDRDNPGVDIVEAKRSARQEEKAVAIAEALPTFQQCAERYIDENWSNWSGKHREQWPASLKRYAYPTIGALTVPQIKPSHIFELLAPIWTDKRETANRVRGRIETVIAKNVDVDDLDFRNPAELTKQLREKLPKRPKQATCHHAALPYAEAPQFMAALDTSGGRAAAALRFLILTVCRTNEVLDARWSEIDQPRAVWRIPGERMKMGEDHCVPLSGPALKILDNMRDGIQSDLIFPSSGDEPFSNMAMLAVLKRMNYSHITVHGFRAPSRPGPRNAPNIRMACAKRRLLTNTNPRPRRPISAARSSRSDAPS